jgi:hypothetical protein
MTMVDPRTLDRLASDRPVAGNGRDELSARHLLRLALDLQLDALLLTLAGAAHARAGSETDSPEAPPWQQWLTQDLDLARRLAVILVETGATTVSTLGGAVTDPRTDVLLNNLTDHYTTMETLFEDLIKRFPTSRWRLDATDALTHCRARLAELRELRHRPVGIPNDHPREFLPGEFMG